MSERCPHSILRSKTTKCPECDALPPGPRRKYPRNLAGIRFGKLICVNVANKGVTAETWRCLCDCGEPVTIGRVSLMKSARLGHVSACPKCRAYAPPQPTIDRPFLDHAPAGEVEPAPPAKARQDVIGKARDVGPDVITFDPEAVIAAIGAAFNLTVEEVVSGDRFHHVVEARAAVYWLLLKHTRMSAVRIARLLRKRDHTTVLHGFKRCEQRRAEDSWYRRRVDEVEKKLEEQSKGAAA